MILKQGKKNVDIKNLKQLYDKEYSFITELLEKVNIPVKDSDSSDTDVDEANPKMKLKENLELKSTERAKSLQELHERLAALREQKYTYKGKKLKNKLQSKLKRKQKVHEKKTERYTSNVRKEDSVSSETKPVAEEPPKPVFTVFSKLDFLGETTTIADKAIMKKETTNKKQLLEKLEKNKTFVKRLEESGNIEKANKIKEEAMWSNVLKKAEGIKVKDDPALLKKSLMKKQAKKKVSEKKWKTRIKAVEKHKLERQKNGKKI